MKERFKMKKATKIILGLIDDSLKITEYENNSVTSWKNLWK